MKKAMQNKLGTKTQQRSPHTAAGRDSVPRFDVEKLGLHFCSAAESERLTKEAVLQELRLRAKAAGKQLRGGEESIVGPDRCDDVRWLLATLQQMRHEFADLIAEKLEKLNQPGADREALVGNIYSDILCVRATNTLFFGDGDLRSARNDKPMATRLSGPQRIHPHSANTSSTLIAPLLSDDFISTEEIHALLLALTRGQGGFTEAEADRVLDWASSVLVDHSFLELLFRGLAKISLGADGAFVFTPMGLEKAASRRPAGGVSGADNAPVTSPRPAQARLAVDERAEAATSKLKQ